VVPGGGVAGGGLAQQDVVTVGGEGRIAARGHRQQHRHQPGGDHREQGERPADGVPPREGEARQVGQPPPPRDPPRDEQQHGEESDALGDHAEPHRRERRVPPAPRRPEHQVSRQAVDAEGDPQRRHRVDLRGPRLQGELQGGEQREAGEHRRPPSPQAAGEVPGQRQRPQAGQRRREQEREPQRAGRGVDAGDEPEEHRRLVGVELAVAVREEPLAGLYHLLADQGEARLVRRPRVAQPDPRPEERDTDGEQQERIPGRLTHPGGP
jgi:hypothetical protein